MDSRPSSADDHQTAPLTPLMPLMAVAMLFALCAVAGAAEPVERIYATICKSTVVIHPDANRFGSGFVVRPGVVATNAHVIAGLRSGIVRIVGVAGDHAIEHVLACDPVHDVALLSVPTLSAPPLPLATVYELKIGQRVYAIGNPGYKKEVFEGTFCDGQVTALRGLDLLTAAPDILHADAIQTNVAVTHGNSGGPLVNDEGEVVGMTGSAVEAQPGVTVAGITFAVPVKHVLELMPDFKAAHYRFYGRLLLAQARKDGAVAPTTPGLLDEGALLRASALMVYRGPHLDRLLATPLHEDRAALALLVDQAIERYVEEKYLETGRPEAALAYLDAIAPMAALTCHANTVRAMREQVVGRVAAVPTVTATAMPRVP